MLYLCLRRGLRVYMCAGRKHVSVYGKCQMVIRGRNWQVKRTKGRQVKTGIVPRLRQNLQLGPHCSKVSSSLTYCTTCVTQWKTSFHFELCLFRDAWKKIEDTDDDTRLLLFNFKIISFKYENFRSGMWVNLGLMGIKLSFANSGTRNMQFPLQHLWLLSNCPDICRPKSYFLFFSDVFHLREPPLVVYFFAHGLSDWQLWKM